MIKYFFFLQNFRDEVVWTDLWTCLLNCLSDDADSVRSSACQVVAKLTGSKVSHPVVALETALGYLVDHSEGDDCLGLLCSILLKINEDDPEEAEGSLTFEKDDSDSFL